MANVLLFELCLSKIFICLEIKGFSLKKGFVDVFLKLSISYFTKRAKVKRGVSS